MLDGGVPAPAGAHETAADDGARAPDAAEAVEVDRPPVVERLVERVEDLRHRSARRAHVADGEPAVLEAVRSYRSSSPSSVRSKKRVDADAAEPGSSPRPGTCRPAAARGRPSTSRPGLVAPCDLTAGMLSQRFRDEARRVPSLGSGRRSLRGAEPGAAPRGRGRARPGVHPRGRRLGQDDDDHAAHRQPGGVRRVRAGPDPRRHVHGQGGDRDAGAAGRASAPAGVPARTFHAAALAQLHYFAALESARCFASKALDPAADRALASRCRSAFARSPTWRRRSSGPRTAG